LNIDLAWKGKKEKEIGYDKKTDKVYIKIDPRYYRPAEVDLLLGDPTKAKEKLKWEPKTKFKELVKIMLKDDLKKEGLKK
jgi:GDPmannose 4,6-dehydratase